MKLFLKIKHWQLFLIFVLPCYFISTSMTVLIISEFILIIFSLWIYSTVVFGQKKIIELGLKSFKTTFFEINCFLFPLVWFFLKLVSTGINESEFFQIRILIIFGSLYFFMAFLNMIYLASKTVLIINKKAKVYFHKLIFTIIGYIFFPIGVWFIQPKINKIIDILHPVGKLTQ